MIPLLKQIVADEIKKIKTIKHSELVYPVHHKGGASVMYPDGPHDGQDQSHTRREEAQHLIGEAHGLGRGQSRVPHLQDALAGRQCLL